MRVRTRRTVVFSLLGLMAVAAGAGVAKAAASLEHACCERTSRSDLAPEPTPCDGFLPLSCCQAAALPGSETPPASAAAALPSHPAMAPILAAPALASASETPIARASPHRLSVVLQV